MRTILYIPIILVLVLTASCKPDGENSNTETVTTEDAVSVSPDIIPALTQAPASTVIPPVPATSPSAQLTPLQAPVKKSGNPQEALNPPHGEPGHRCEIPVGAPLSSAPKGNQPAPVQVAPQPAPVQVSGPAPGNTQPGNSVTIPDPASTVTPPGMNPPHGQPGHRCEIPVGSPLPTE